MTANTDVVRVKLADATDAPAESDTCETILEFINSLDATSFNYGFYSDWEPMSYANHRSDASDPGFNEPNGYEPDMIRAIEELAGGKVTFNAYGVGPAFSGIWYKAATDDFDFIGGGIAQLDARTVNEAGKQIVMYGTTNAVLRQSLLVPSDSTLESYDDLTSEHTVGPHKGTTGEGRMLVLTGISDAAGYLRSGTVVTMYDGSKFTTDGTQYITSGLASPELADRASLIAPGDDVPAVIYFHAEADQLTAVMGGDIDAIPGVDAIPRGEIGNIIAAAASEGALKVVGFDDSNIEAMGFYYPNTDEGYATMGIMDRLVNFITADQTIMFNEYYNDERVFMARALSCFVTDPCACPDGMGFSSESGKCEEGKTTNCIECSTLETCVTNTCEEAGCPAFDDMRTCQCDPGCVEYDNCCEDALDQVCLGPCDCPEGYGWSSENLRCQLDSDTNCMECPTKEGCDSRSCAEAECPEGYNEMRTCQCNYECMEYNNCCDDAPSCYGDATLPSTEVPPSDCIDPGFTIEGFETIRACVSPTNQNVLLNGRETCITANSVGLDSFAVSGDDYGKLNDALLDLWTNSWYLNVEGVCTEKTEEEAADDQLWITNEMVDHVDAQLEAVKADLGYMDRWKQRIRDLINQRKGNYDSATQDALNQFM